ncbi:MAG: hypothetical protein FOGNACKC_00926 [Anaerolineae bacterium]|nr:hypothetical protein [Anaerolineae bacterium]
MAAYKPQLPTPTAQWVQADEPKSGGLTHIADIPAGASAAKRVPVIVLLHGWNGNERQMWSHRSAFPRNVAVVSPRGPVGGDGGDSQFGWFTGNAGTARSKLASFIQALPNLYPVDGNRVILVGFSQGAVVANDYALTPNTHVAGVASLSGKLGGQKTGSATKVPVLITHGHSDPEIAPKNADRTKEAYDKAGATVTVFKFGGGHYLNKAGRSKLGEWLRNVLKETKSMSDELLLDAEMTLLEAELTLASVKANSYHDPKTGKFAPKAGGKKYGMNAAGGGGATSTPARGKKQSGGGAVNMTPQQAVEKFGDKSLKRPWSSDPLEGGAYQGKNSAWVGVSMKGEQPKVTWQGKTLEQHKQRGTFDKAADHFKKAYSSVIAVAKGTRSTPDGDQPRGAAYGASVHAKILEAELKKHNLL